jgi:Ca-activated chloride channel family protein
MRHNTQPFRVFCKKIATVLLLLLAFIALSLDAALAQEFDESDVRTDIVVALDVSAFMKGQDFKPTRLEAAKNALMTFNETYPQFRIGVIIVGEEAKTLIPLTASDTFSVESFSEKVKSVTVNTLQGTGTALGEALDLAIKEYDAIGATNENLILLSDGGDNEEPDILTNAVRLARQKELKVFCVGIGTKGTVQMLDANNNEISVENTYQDRFLIKISELTGGSFFQVNNTEELNQVLIQIGESIKK